MAKKSDNPSLSRFLNFVEWMGNLLPHPVTLFALFSLGVVIISGVGGFFEWSVVDPRPAGTKGRADDGMIHVVSLMNGDGFRRMMQSLVTNFVNFVPLGTVLVSLLGVGVAERSGLISATIRALVYGAPKALITAALVFAGVVSNTASELGYVVIVPLGAIIFYSLGRHPLAGLAAAFAGVSGGYSANLLIGTVDPLLAGITQEAARLFSPDYEVHPAVNWYFMIGSTFLITGLGTFITTRIVEPTLGPFQAKNIDPEALKEESFEPVNSAEKRALFGAGLAALGMALLFIYFAGPQPFSFATLSGGFLTATTNLFLNALSFVANIILWPLHILPGFGVLRDPITDGLLPSPFLRSIVAMIFMFFIVPGLVYGKMIGNIKKDTDVIDSMAIAMSTLGLYIVLVFFAAQFVAYFNWTNFGAMIAVVGSDLIIALGLDNPLVFIPYILMCCIVNLMLGSASAQWAVTAPIFVPMLMRIGYSPEVIQAAYRIGDSVTNIITPMMSYFGIIFAVAARYDRKLGIGTLISIMLPYSVIFLIGWTIFFYLWVFVFQIPVGPGAPTYFQQP